MKISTEQLAALQESEIRRTKTETAKGFDALMAQQLSGTVPQGVATNDLDAKVLHGHYAPVGAAVLGSESAATGQQATVMEFASQVENVLSTVEQYASVLAEHESGDLRGAYGLLEKVTADVGALKSAYPDIATQQPELALVMNDLEVMAVTERIKFNRGDYL